MPARLWQRPAGRTPQVRNNWLFGATAVWFQQRYIEPKPVGAALAIAGEISCSLAVNFNPIDGVCRQLVAAIL